MAADLPKEGTWSGTYTGMGTYKATQIGPDRALVYLDVTGLVLSSGFPDHMTIHCWGTDNYTKGMGQFSGYCVGTDPAGDQIAWDCPPSEKHTMDQKSYRGSCTFTTGTGKYTGVSGGNTYETHGSEFRPVADGVFVLYNILQGNYKLP